MKKQDSESQQAQSVSSTQSRRKFLVKATAGAAIASIPAKSVWATGLTNSIVASGHGSDFANGVQFHLLEPSDWVSLDKADLAHRYKTIFGGKPAVGSILGNTIKSWKRKKITLGAILGIDSYVKTFISEADGKFIDAHSSNGVKFTVDGNVSYMSYSDVKSALSTPYSGAEDLNKLIVSAYLNAKYSGSHGAIYPVVQSSYYPHAPYSSVSDFARKLHASVGHSNSRDLLNKLHYSTNSLAEYRH